MTTTITISFIVEDGAKPKIRLQETGDKIPPDMLMKLMDIAVSKWKETKIPPKPQNPIKNPFKGVSGLEFFDEVIRSFR